LRQQIHSVQEGYQNEIRNLTGVMVTVEERGKDCSVCHGPTRVLKTVPRSGVTLRHGSFHTRETVRVCISGCTKQGSLVTQHSAMLAELFPPKSTVGYDVMVHVGLERFIHHRQREEIRENLEREHGIRLSTGEISTLGTRFLVYLEALHEAAAPALNDAMATDGGWPLHADATGECGRGTLLLAYSGWRKWVLGSWKIPSENADAIFPRLQETVTRFGPPCAIMRDLGHAMEDATERLAKTLHDPIPILACHQHFLSDIGTDLLEESHDKLRDLFRQLDVRKDLRAFARDHGRRLGTEMDQAREAVRDWLKQSAAEHRLPEGSAGIATLRACAQWALDYAADGTDQGFPFDLPYLDFYVRCMNVSWAVEAFLRNPPAGAKAKGALNRLHRILGPLNCDVPPLAQIAMALNERFKLFTELRTALRLVVKPSRDRQNQAAPTDAQPAVQELRDIRKAVEDLDVSLRQRRPERGPAKDMRQAIDIILTHLDRHGKFLWGHVIPLPEQLGGGVRLVDRTNNIDEGLFHKLKHGERRRSGRKNLAQDLELLPPGALLAFNLTRPDYVEIVCGNLDRLAQLFAGLDGPNRHCSLAAATLRRTGECDVTRASLNRSDRQLVRTGEIEQRILAAAMS
jgi:hypothetical protein